MATAATKLQPAKVQTNPQQIFCEDLTRLEQERADVTREYVTQEARLRMATLIATPDQFAFEKERLEFLKNQWRRINGAYLDHLDVHHCGR